MSASATPFRTKDGFEVSFPTQVDIVMIRTFDTPRALVWEMWTKAEHVRQWWGPHGFDNDSVELDLRPGGVFRVGMKTPDGSPCPCEGVFVEIIAPERLVYEGLPHVHPCGSGLPPRARVTVTFTDEGEKTRVSVHTRLLNAEGCQDAIDEGFAIGWQQSLERLNRLMTPLSTRN